MTIRAIIFDLDGVLVTTDELHYRAWKRLADAEGIPFDRRTNERLRGVSRMESLSIVLERAARSYSPEEREAMASRKNAWYREMLGELGSEALLPGAMEFVGVARRRGLKLAVASSSRNGRSIMDRLGLTDRFDAIVDGNDISYSKPDPEVFIKAAAGIGVPASECLVVEDAEAGVEAGARAGMRVLGVGSAASDDRADIRAPGLGDVDLDVLLAELDGKISG